MEEKTSDEIACRNASLSSLKLYLDEARFGSANSNGGSRATAAAFDDVKDGCDSNGFSVEFAACEALLADVNVIIENDDEDVKKGENERERSTVEGVHVDEKDESYDANKSAAASEERGSGGVSFAALQTDADDVRFDEGMLAAMHGTIRRVTCACFVISRECVSHTHSSTSRICPSLCLPV